jgi:hypothetical protein
MFFRLPAENAQAFVELDEIALYAQSALFPPLEKPNPIRQFETMKPPPAHDQRI